MINPRRGHSAEERWLCLKASDISDKSETYERVGETSNELWGEGLSPCSMSHTRRLRSPQCG